jgi:hypothetical protein
MSKILFSARVWASVLLAIVPIGSLSAAATAAVVEIPGVGAFEIAYDATNPAEQINSNAEFRGADGVATNVFPESVSDAFYQDETPTSNDAGYLRTTEGPFGAVVIYHFHPTQGLFDGTFRVTSRANLVDPGRVVGQATDRFGFGVQFFDTDADAQGDPDETGQFVETTLLTLPEVTTDLYLTYRIINPEGGTAGNNGVQLFRSDNQEDASFVVTGNIVFPEPSSASALAILILSGLVFRERLTCGPASQIT